MAAITRTVKTGGYVDGFKEAKRLISEGRAQLKSAQKLMDNEKYEYVLDANYRMLAETHMDGESRDKVITDLSEIERIITNRERLSGEKAHDSAERIMRGLEVYRNLLTYENTPHFKRIKTAINHTLDEFSNLIPAEAREKYSNALFIGPE